MKTLSVTLIVKNEEDNLARLLPQLTFADEVIIVDTGSTDGTVAVAKNFTTRVYNFLWCDDFSKARNYAISKATCDYIMWLDADDIVPLETQKLIMGWKKVDMGWKNAQENADFYYMKYEMDTQIPFWFWRERIVKRTKNCRFKGFIHEAIIPFGTVAYLDAKVCHRPSASHEQRNLSIYLNAIKNGRRFSLRDKFYYGKTLVECGLTDEALTILRKFASNARAYSADRVECYKLLSRMAMNVTNVALARIYLTRSLAVMPPSSEVCCLLGNTYYAERNYLHASHWYTLALACHNQSGFVNEYYAKFLPNLQLSVCYWQLGDRAQAARCHEIAKSIAPNDPTIAVNDKWFL
ncbi:MAG: glycosyltransferase family 2 protein [Clostridiales bacterium]|nr:glycosyltransferase family 2 protein [Clostridiales bacterium]